MKQVEESSCFPEYVIFKDVEMLKKIKNLNG